MGPMLYPFLIHMTQGLVPGKVKYVHNVGYIGQAIMGIYFFFSKKLDKIEALCFILLEK